MKTQSVIQEKWYVPRETMEIKAGEFNENTKQYIQENDMFHVKQWR